MGIVTLDLRLCNLLVTQSGKVRLEKGMSFVSSPIPAHGTNLSPFLSRFPSVSPDLVQSDLKTLSTALDLVKLMALSEKTRLSTWSCR